MQRHTIVPASARQPLFGSASERPYEPLIETCVDTLQEAQADRAAGLVRGVALLGPYSRNGYRYHPEAIERALPLYEGRPVFLDHAEGSPLRRRLRDLVGKVVAVRLENGRLRGDLRLFGPNAGWLFDLIEAAPADIGMSHVVLARRDASGQEVIHIERVLSVDMVAFPATTHSFAEGAAGAASAAQSVPGPQTTDFFGDHAPHDGHSPWSLPRVLEELREKRSQVGPEVSALLASHRSSNRDEWVHLLADALRQALAEAPRADERTAGNALPASIRRALVVALRGR
ncbi:MAG: hypothetical protein C4297_07075 [Gemmataceae bacterium]